MSSPPSPPPPPDPYKTASAQTAANIFTAVAQTWLANADEDRPDGTVKWTVPSYATVVEKTRNSNGDVTGQIDHAIPRFHKKVELTPVGAEIFKDQQLIAGQMNRLAKEQSHKLIETLHKQLSVEGLTPRPNIPVLPIFDDQVPDALTFAKRIGDIDVAAHLNAMRDAIMERIDWQIGVDRDARRVQLSHQGIFAGSLAFERDMLAFDRQVTDARNRGLMEARAEQTRVIQLQAMIAEFKNKWMHEELSTRILLLNFKNKQVMRSYETGVHNIQFLNVVRQHELQEQMSVRAVHVNELSGLMHGGQIGMPQFQPFQHGTVANTPVGDYVYRTAELKQRQWEKQVDSNDKMNGQIMQMVGGGLSAMMMSDRRLKSDIDYAGTDADGVRWYWWRYLWDRPGTRRFGVMAQEVAHLPGVVVRIGGYLAVRYERLLGTQVKQY